MSVSLFKSQMGCIILGKTLRRCYISSVSKQSVRQYSRVSPLVRPVQCLPFLYESTRNPLNTLLLLKLSHIPKRDMSNTNRTKLMDFEVIYLPNIFKSCKLFFYKFFTRKLTEGLAMENFLQNCVKPLVVVTNLITESRFQELEGLLTDECRAEVEKNVNLLTPSQKNHIAVKEEDILLVCYLDWDVIQDKPRDGKTFLQITVGYHIVENFDQSRPKQQFNMFFKPELFTIYNCRFIRDCTEGVCDQWKINAINLLRWEEAVGVEK